MKVRFPLGLLAVAFLWTGVSAVSGQTVPRSNSVRQAFTLEPGSIYDQDASRLFGFPGNHAELLDYEDGAFRQSIDPEPTIRSVQIDDSELVTPTPLPTITPSSTPIISPTPFPFPTATASIAPEPTPDASPSATSSAEPTPTIAPSPSPSASVPLPPTPPPSATPAFPVPPPNPAAFVAMPTRPEPAPPSGPPSLLYLQQITPAIEVWRADSVTPELPNRRGKQVGPVAVAINEVVIVRLQFGLLASGKSVVVTASAGVVLDPPQQILTLQPNADRAFAVRLSEGYSNGAIRFYCEGISTTLTLARFVPQTQALSQRTNNGARR